MKKSGFVFAGILALALVFTLVACTQPVEVKNWPGSGVTAPAFVSASYAQPRVNGNILYFYLTASSGTGTAIISNKVQYVGKVEGKDGFFYNGVANVSYMFGNDAYSCSDTTFGTVGLNALPPGTHSIRIGIQYTGVSSGGATSYVWSEPFQVTK